MTQTPNPLTQKILDELNEMVRQNKIDPLVLMEAASVISSNVQDWTNSKISKIEEMISEWELTMGDEDKTFYSLGLRRAIDVIRGESAFQQLPVLEKPDTPLE